MERTRQDIIKYALEAGFADIRFASADEFTKTAPGLTACPRSILPEATCIIVLFLSYLPAKAAPKGSISLSSYYTASNFSYHASKKLTVYLQEDGAKAVHCPLLPAKDSALRTGGYIGDNGFYYHEKFGSYVSIQTVLTDAFLPIDYTLNTKGKLKECMHCGACAAACPSAAVGNIQNCLRYHINKIIPIALRDDVYQLFGCELCQSACPQNSKEESRAYTYPLLDLLEGKHVKQIKELAGSNLVRANRLLSQAVVYAANKKEYDLARLIKQISTNAPEPVCSHALWAYNKLKR